jgi:hypothetical protein
VATTLQTADTSAAAATGTTGAVKTSVQTTTAKEPSTASTINDWIPIYTAEDLRRIDENLSGKYMQSLRF